VKNAKLSLWYHDTLCIRGYFNVMRSINPHLTYLHAKNFQQQIGYECLSLAMSLSYKCLSNHILQSK